MHGRREAHASREYRQRFLAWANGSDAGRVSEVCRSTWRDRSGGCWRYAGHGSELGRSQDILCGGGRTAAHRGRMGIRGARRQAETPWSSRSHPMPPPWPGEDSGRARLRRYACRIDRPWRPTARIHRLDGGALAIIVEAAAVLETSPAREDVSAAETRVRSSPAELLRVA